MRWLLPLLLAGCHNWTLLLTAPEVDGGDGRIAGLQCTSDGQCASNHCVDSVCCETLCDGQCQACNLDTQGECATVMSGPPRGNRKACNGGGSDCQGACDGSSATKCHYTAGKTCGSACDGQCNEVGECSTSTMGACPGGFACGAGACLTSCNSEEDCQPGFHCANMQCERPGEADCLDGADDNNDGKPDCEDPTCASQVVCVPAPAGAELGILGSSPCPSPYGIDEAVFQSPAPNGTCSGCTCKALVSCRYDLTSSNADNVCTSPSPFVSVYATNESDSSAMPITAPCASVAPATNPKSLRVTNVHTGSDCSNDSSKAKPDPPTWTVAKSFCAVTRSSMTCQAGYICVARPPAGARQCARVGMALATCPSGYPTGKQTWYDPDQYQENRSCVCSCGRMGGDCQAAVFMNVGSTCPIGTAAGMVTVTDPGQNCVHSVVASFNYWSNIGGLQVYTSAGENATCTSSGTAFGTVTPINGSTVCCMQ